MAKNLNYRCLHCGGELAFSPASQKWKCDYCESEFALEELQSAGKAEAAGETLEKGQAAGAGEKATDGTETAKGSCLVEYTCSYCGAKIITDATMAATFCAYCQNPVVISEQLVGDFAPEKLIPFAKTKEKVMEEYRAFVKKPLTPRYFYEKNNIEKLTGLYVPFFLYDTRGEGDIEISGTKVRVWQDSQNRYTKTDTYRCEIEGGLEFENVPVDASSKTDDNAMDSIEPFDFDKLVDFSPAYLAGFMAERYDVSDDETEQRMKRRVDRSLKNELMAQAPSYDTQNVTGESLRQEVHRKRYVLLPTWILNTSYKGKPYLFAMNGQTGKFVGNLPIDKKKMLFYGLTVFAGSFAACLAVVGMIMNR